MRILAVAGCGALMLRVAGCPPTPALSASAGVTPPAAAVAAGASAGTTWPAYGGDAGGTRYSAALQITPGNVDGLREQWRYSTGDLNRRDPAALKRAKFETTPILVDDELVFCSSFNEVIARDPATGRQRWRHDPQIATDLRPANGYNCRGVAQWHDPLATAGTACATRILTGTVDARLIALDARSGAPCAGFGDGGTVRIGAGKALRWPGEFAIASAPVVVGEVVVLGSSIGDNGRTDAPSGRVRAYDVRSGVVRWTWDPLIDDAGAPAGSAVARTARADADAAASGAFNARAGATNVWAPMSVDPKRGLVFLPTSSPSPDFYGGGRPGNNGHADSVVALRAEDGTLVWAFQIVKHDVWDYDVPAQPTLATVPVDGVMRDAVVQATKQGYVFVLDRDTGQPLFPVEERTVPQGGAPGEVLSPTQTAPVDLPALVPQSIRAVDAWGPLGLGRGGCRDQLAALRNEGLYTPPSTRGSVVFPMTGGGANWGGVSVDPAGVVYVNTSRAVHAITLIPRAEFAAAKAAHPKLEISPQTGAPYGMKRQVLTSFLGMLCNPPPWGTIAALDLRTKRILWQSTLGTTEELAPLGIALHTGTPNFGGPVATAGGLVFIGAAGDRYLRAFDASNGTERWRGRLPAPPIATPMTYLWQGRQYVVVAAGGHPDLGSLRGDAIVAFALPAPGEAARGWWDRTVHQPGGHFWLGVAATAAALVLLVRLSFGLRKRRR